MLPFAPVSRPLFAKAYPEDPTLQRLLDAFVEGDFALVRREAPELARSTQEPEVARAALDLKRRTEPDSTTITLLLASAGLLLFLILWFHTHRLAP